DAGTGSNVLTGGGGADDFVFHSSGLSQITDFTAGTDKLVFSGLEFGGNLANGVDATDFTIGSSTSHVAGGGFVFDPTTSALWWDHDGTSALSQVATLLNVTKLTAQDFLIA